MKKIIKIISALIIIIILAVSYLSIFGLKTKKFNNQIKENIKSLNQKVDLELKEVQFLLNPLNLSFTARTLGAKIIIDNKLLELESLKSKISLKSLIKKEFIIENINISTKALKINDIIKLARSFNNSPQLFLINNIIKDGFIVGDVNLNFDDSGKIKNDYIIKGYVKDGKLDFFKKYNTTNLNLFFNIKKEKYFLEEINGRINDFKFSSASIKIEEKKNLFSIKGKFLTKEKNDYSILVKETFPNFLKNIDIKNIELKSNNNFSFNINKKLKVSNLSLKSEIDLKKIKYKKENLNIKKYFSNFKDLIKLTSHKIFIDYNKNKLSLKGKGDLLIEDKIEQIEYSVEKNNNDYLFNTTLYITKSELLLDILNYKKKENLNSTISLNGVFKKNKNIEFNSIVFKENNNKISIKDLTLNNKFKVLDLELLDLLFVNDNKINNQMTLSKKGKNYLLEGGSFDVSKMLDSMFNNDNDAKLSNFLENFNTNLDIKIKKVYLDSEYSVNNFKGTLSLIKSKIDKLEIKSFFKNNKILIASINHMNDEKITTLYSDYARPFVKKYKFIKGFEEGSLDFHSVQKNRITSARLKIYDFKLKELPGLTKLLSLASLQGIADTLSGEGIRFNDFEMKYKSNKKLMTIDEIYALGPAISILMDGYIEKDKLVSLRGTLVPATTINKVIGSIPLLGNILVGKKAGEGVFGVSFKIKGPPKDLKTSVNPIKTLTPRFITRTLEKVKKE